MKRSILLMCGAWGVGGVEKLHVTMANAFLSQGWHASIVFFRLDSDMLLKDLDDRAQVLNLQDMSLSAKSRTRLRQFMIDNDVGFVENSWCNPYRVARFVSKASRGLGVKLISMQHAQPGMQPFLLRVKNPIVKAVFNVIARVNLRLVYEVSDAFVVVSSRYTDLFARFIWRRTPEKLRAICYPLTTKPIPSTPKDNIILCVSRFDEVQKRVSRVIDVWLELEQRLKGWRLDLVGDGSARAQYESKAAGCKSIRFCGYQQPDYARAKVFVMTSDVEGRPLALTEAMANGCVPVIYGGYQSVYDVVDGTNGIVTPQPFSVEYMANVILGICQNQTLLQSMSEEARKWALRFAPDKVVRQWISVFETL